MAPLLEVDSPSAQYAMRAQDTLRQNQFAARRAQAQPLAAKFPVSSAAEDLALRAEAYLDPGNAYVAKQRRERVLMGIGAPNYTPVYDDTYDMSSSDEQDVADYEETSGAIDRATRLGEMTTVKAQSGQRSALAKLTDKQRESIQNNIKQEILSMLPGLLGDTGTPVMHDWGISLGSSTTVAAYQLLVTFSNTASDKVESFGLEKLLPPKFNTRSIVGWGSIVNAAFLLLYSGVGLMTVSWPVILIIILAGGAVGGALAAFASLFS